MSLEAMGKSFDRTTRSIQKALWAIRYIQLGLITEEKKLDDDLGYTENLMLKLAHVLRELHEVDGHQTLLLLDDYGNDTFDVYVSGYLKKTVGELRNDIYNEKTKPEYM